MRMLMFTLALAAASPAMAQTTAFTDPTGRYSFSYPSAWPVDPPRRQSPAIELLVVGGADADCTWAVLDRPELTGISIDRVKRTAALEVKPADFITSLAGLTQADGAQQADVKRLDLNGWPAHLATLSPAPQPIVAIIHFRPGFEARGVCRSYDGKDHSAEFTALLTSFSSPKDAEWTSADAAEKQQSQALKPPEPEPEPEPKAKGKAKAKP